MKKFLLKTLLTATTLISPLAADLYIDEHGFWHGEEAVLEHKTDYRLAEAIAEFFQSEGATTIVDLGCGMGEYVKIFRHFGLECEGYDGNPETPLLTSGVCGIADLSQPLDLGQKYDWVMSLEVGEHLPQVYETTFLENLDRHNINGIVLSWALIGQGGYGHFNEQNNEYVKARMESFGYINDIDAENALRANSTFSWFANTVMVFRRQ